MGTASASPGPRAAPVSPAVPSRRAELRIGAGCAILGTVAHIVSGLLHGRLSAGSDGAKPIFVHVLGHPSWAADNLVSLLAVLAWLVMFVVLARSLRIAGGESGLGGFLGQLAVAFMIFGLATVSLLYLIDSVVLPTLATEWAHAAPAQRPGVLAMGDTVQSLLRLPLFDGLPLFILGVPYGLMGAALIRRPRVVPAWLAWLGCLTGLATFLSACLWVVGVNVVPELVLWTVYQPLIWIWTFAVGVVLLRRRGPGHPADAAP